MDWTTIIVAAVTGLFTGGVGVALVNGYFSKKLSAAQAKLTEAQAELTKAQAKDTDNDSLSDAYKQMAQTVKVFVASMQERIDAVHKRVGNLEIAIEGRDMTIEKLTKENKNLQSEVDKLILERDQQIEINRSQSQLLSDLRIANAELSERIRCLEEKLGDGCN